MSVAFLIMYPLGGAIVRFLWQMTGLETVMVHYSIQLITTVFVLGAFGVATYASASAHNVRSFLNLFYEKWSFLTFYGNIELQVPSPILRRFHNCWHSLANSCRYHSSPFIPKSR